MTTSADDTGLVVTQWKLSPKLGAGERLLYWKGPSTEHPGAAMWTTEAAEAARFPTVEAVAEALGGLMTRYEIAGYQHCLW